ncbi:Tryptophan-associated membrane protein [Actinomycetales bacterium JB111]|nr:Tryptophan-associated membrane protein [Actinomycetales bacterium JB111]
MRRLGRGTAVLLILAASGVVLLCALPTWSRAELQTATGWVELATTGMSGSPAVWAGALVGAAAALFTALAGRIGTIVAGAATLLAGVVVVVGALGALRDPGGLLMSEATVQAGTTSPTLRDAAATAWPIGALVAGVLLAALAVIVVVSSRRWTVAGRRFERQGAAPHGDGAAAGSAAPSEPPAAGDRTGSASAEADALRDRFVDDWDVIGRGEDPTGDDR